MNFVSKKNILELSDEYVVADNNILATSTDEVYDDNRQDHAVGGNCKN